MVQIAVASAPDPDRWLTIRQVADRFKVHPRTIRNWVKAGKFPRPIKPNGGKVWFDSEEIDRSIAKLRDEPQPAEQ